MRECQIDANRLIRPPGWAYSRHVGSMVGSPRACRVGRRQRGRGAGVVLHDLRLPPPDLIKVDVEGAEYRAVPGAEKAIGRGRPAIISEISLEMTSGSPGCPVRNIWNGYRGPPVSHVPARPVTSQLVEHSVGAIVSFRVGKPRPDSRICCSSLGKSLIDREQLNLVSDRAHSDRRELPGIYHAHRLVDDRPDTWSGGENVLAAAARALPRSGSSGWCSLHVVRTTSLRSWSKLDHRVVNGLIFELDNKEYAIVSDDDHLNHISRALSHKWSSCLNAWV